MSGGFLLDTNVPSELTKPSPNNQVREWVEAHDDGLLYLSVVSVGELRKGCALLPQGKRRLQLERWLDDYLLPSFEGRILPVTEDIGSRWGLLSAACRLKGKALSMADGIIAATGIEHDLTIVTRNIKDYLNLGVRTLDPWEVL